jgi:hypothetical protein
MSEGERLGLWQKLRGVGRTLRDEWWKRWPEVILRDVAIAAILGGAFFLAASCSEGRRASQAERLENLRFLREVAMRETGATTSPEPQSDTTQSGDVATSASEPKPWPFRYLDLQGMALNGLRFPCRDETVLEVCFLKADFTHANLRGADMRFMDLTGADFTDADLRDAKLEGSVLSGAIMTGADMAGAELRGACDNAGTMWPEDIGLPDDNEPTGACNPGI